MINFKESFYLVGIKIYTILLKIEQILLKIGNLGKSSLLVFSYFLVLSLGNSLHFRFSFSTTAGKYNVSHKLTNHILLERLILQALSRKDNKNVTTNQRRVCLAYGSMSYAQNELERSENNSVLCDFRVDPIFSG